MSLTIGNPVLQTPSTLAEKNGPSRKNIHEAAQQFESLMIGELLKSVRAASSDGWLGSGDDDSSDSAVSMAETQFASAMARSGGIGLAAMIERSVAREAGQNVANTVEPSSGAK
jgi:flagellar protein FlgJ